MGGKLDTLWLDFVLIPNKKLLALEQDANLLLTHQNFLRGEWTAEDFVNTESKSPFQITRKTFLRGFCTKNPSLNPGVLGHPSVKR